MRYVQIKNSYCIWSIKKMQYLIKSELVNKYGDSSAYNLLHRSYWSMYVEWWLHNIGYYITKPLCSNDYFKYINERFKHVDLEEW